jgi:hypothetical protein
VLPVTGVRTACMVPEKPASGYLERAGGGPVPEECGP